MGVSFQNGFPWSHYSSTYRENQVKFLLIEIFWEFMKMFYEIFSDLIQKRQIKDYQVAKDLNLSSSRISDWRNGHRLPSVENLIKLADYFGVSTDYLLGRTDKPEVNR